VSKRRLLWWWLGTSFASTGLLLVAVFGIVLAALGASFTGCETKALPPTLTGPAGPPPSAYALQSIPPERLRLYEQAGRRFDVDWSFLASIGAQECGNGSCAGVNNAGCAGPMQIAYVRNSECSLGSGPTLWERYAVSAHPGQPPNISDPGDAIFTAARILRQDKGAPPTGGSYSEYRQAACNYYGSCGDATVAYADQVMARAVQYGFNGTGSPAPSSPALAQPPEEEPPETCNASYFGEGETGSPAIVKLAESQIGQGEQPENSNCTKYGPCEEWCSLFVAWVWQHAGVPLPGVPADYAYSGALYTWLQEHHGRILPPTATPSPGDAVFYGNDPSESVHVGIVQRVYPDGRITEIDGNDEHNEVGIAGPFLPSQATVKGKHIYGYAQPPTAPRTARVTEANPSHTTQFSRTAGRKESK
jgi:hypothetical protein